MGHGNQRRDHEDRGADDRAGAAALKVSEFAVSSSTQCPHEHQDAGDQNQRHGCS
jgi:hypothetical protein